RSRTARSGIDPGRLKNLPHHRRGDLVAEPDQFAVDASVSPSWVSPGPTAAPVPARVARRVVGRVVGPLLSSGIGPPGGRPLGGPAPAGSGGAGRRPAAWRATRAPAEAPREVAACSAR